MMGMLTFLVIMVAIGTLIQRVDVVQRFFGGEIEKLLLNRDEAFVRANVLSAIDVLRNDKGLEQGDADRLIVARQPDCGRVFAREGRLHYLPAERCAGAQNFRYAISGRSREQTGEVVVVVRTADPEPRGIAADAQRDLPAAAPMSPRPAEGQVANTLAPKELQPSERSGTVAAVDAAPAAPRPQAPASAPRPGTLAGDTAGSPTTVMETGTQLTGIAPEESLPAPELNGSASGLAAAPESASAPAALQPTRVAPEEPTPGAGEMPASTQAPGASPSVGQAPVAGTATSQPSLSPPAAPAGEQQQAGPALAGTGTAPTTPGDTGMPSVPGGSTALDSSIPQSSLPQIGTSSEGASATGDPGSGDAREVLAAIRSRGEGTELAAVNTKPPTTLATPSTPGTPAAVVEPAPAAVPGDAQPASLQPGPPQPAMQQPTDSTAAMPPAPQPCTVLPALVLDVKPAGLTEVIIEAPCQANTVAELAYDGLRFGIALDTAGNGSIAAVGVQRASDAVVRFDDGETLEFNIPFADMERIDRVALVWEMPVDLELHAFEFGASPLSPGHVRPDQPRSFAEVRRRGGGYLTKYRPVGDIGQRIEVYSFWRRHSGDTGVVDLKLDFASRVSEGPSGTCGQGALSEPDFTVLRARAGVLERPQRRSLAALDCAAVAAMEERYIGDAVDDLIVRSE
jgi:hypothetical protein